MGYICGSGHSIFHAFVLKYFSDTDSLTRWQYLFYFQKGKLRLWKNLEKNLVADPYFAAFCNNRPS